jgi:hypothetical protein
MLSTGTEEKKGKGTAFRPHLCQRPGLSTRISASSPPPHALHVDIPTPPLTPREGCLLAACTFTRCKHSIKDLKDFLVKVEQRVKQPTYSHFFMKDTELKKRFAKYAAQYNQVSRNVASGIDLNLWKTPQVKILEAGLREVNWILKYLKLHGWSCPCWQPGYAPPYQIIRGKLIWSTSWRPRGLEDSCQESTSIFISAILQAYLPLHTERELRQKEWPQNLRSDLEFLQQVDPEWISRAVAWDHILFWFTRTFFRHLDHYRVALPSVTSSLNAAA